MIELSMLLMTGDRPQQVACCLTSLLGQAPGATLYLVDNGERSVLDNAMVRGILDLAQQLDDWRVVSCRQERKPLLSAMQKEALSWLPAEGLFLWLEDDTVWGRDAIPRLVAGMQSYRAVSPVVVDVVNPGFPDFTGLERFSDPTAHVAPMHHLYTPSVAPFGLDLFCNVFMCRLQDAHGIEYPVVPVGQDMMFSKALPDPNGCIPSAEVYHLPHTRSDTQKGWKAMDVPGLLRSGVIEWKMR